jgi:hypothetical protein
MRDIRKLLALSIFPILLPLTATSARAAIATNPGVTFTGPHASLALGDAASATSPAELQSTVAADLLRGAEASTTQLPQSTEDAGDVIRHRGFRKFLLIALICGGLIRLLTSPSYLRFIADALDPKTF